MNKPQGMALSAEANITGLNHTFQQLITQLALCKLGNTRESIQNRILIVYTDYWYRTTCDEMLIYHVYSTVFYQLVATTQIIAALG